MIRPRSAMLGETRVQDLPMKQKEDQIAASTSGSTMLHKTFYGKQRDLDTV